jgi:hypothetical protein
MITGRRSSAVAMRALQPQSQYLLCIDPWQVMPVSNIVHDLKPGYVYTRSMTASLG